mmetsp:Transcript_8174/g.22592  ORF Transcript_8174/g.22592 Transcript_8174/m.22592 type:complete len:127 (-) Transcript_8174:62-442(-)
MGCHMTSQQIAGMSKGSARYAASSCSGAASAGDASRMPAQTQEPPVVASKKKHVLRVPRQSTSDCWSGISPTLAEQQRRTAEKADKHVVIFGPCHAQPPGRAGRMSRQAVYKLEHTSTEENEGGDQ